ncbi:DJ-1/PfpI family protein [Brevibacterium linens]|uniref:DJ-1/PfpI family protein n=1 Tax=Brevibacterium linens TaxID=1703 RepID=UPI003F89123B
MLVAVVASRPDSRPPDQLRIDTEAVRFVRDFVASGKSVTSFCHGPWTLIEGGVANGRTLTSHPSIRTDLRNAGVNVVDEEMARDGNLITSHSPDDLPAFFSAIAELFSKAGEVP